MIANLHEHRFDINTLICPCGLTHQQYCKQKNRVSTCKKAKARFSELTCPICHLMLFMPRQPEYPNYDCYGCGFSIPTLITLRGAALIEFLKTMKNPSKIFNNLLNCSAERRRHTYVK